MQNTSGLTYRPPIANRPSNHTPRVATGPDFQREDLSRIQPWHGQPRGSENHSVKEYEEDGSTTNAGGVSTAGFGVDRSAGETTGAEHTNTLTD